MQARSVQYVNAPPPVDPTVIAGNVKSTIKGEHTAVGFVMIKSNGQSQLLTKTFSGVVSVLAPVVEHKLE